MMPCHVSLHSCVNFVFPGVNFEESKECRRLQKTSYSDEIAKDCSTASRDIAHMSCSCISCIGVTNIMIMYQSLQPCRRRLCQVLPWRRPSPCLLSPLPLAPRMAPTRQQVERRTDTTLFSLMCDSRQSTRRRTSSRKRSKVSLYVVLSSRCRAGEDSTAGRLSFYFRGGSLNDARRSRSEF